MTDPKAVEAVKAMTQGDAPDLSEWLAAWEAGLIDITPKGMQTLLEETHKMLKTGSK
jgi:hypothetical protein